jgi:hypothetical protein
MEKRRFVVDFSTTQYVTMIVEATDADAAVDDVIDKLFDNKEFLDELQAQMVSRMRDPHSFGENTECEVACEDYGDWSDTPVANEYIG